MTSTARILVAAAVALGLGVPSGVLARPFYFENFTAHFGISPGEDLHACGVCHRKWEGTGARNPFGTAVEQQLYVGKTILDAIDTVVAGTNDTDGDGFSDLDEITVHHTLPGYSCADYTLASETPPNFQSLITPGVPSCLEPRDILVQPDVATFRTEVGKSADLTVTVVNNGADLPLTVSGFALLAGTDPSFSVTGPATPIVIPVGQTADLTLHFAPTAAGLPGGTLRISSDDPDEADYDLDITGVGFFRILAPAADRAACLADVQRETERLLKAELVEWGGCYLDEVGGRACDAGKRDRKLAKAEERFRAAVGGAKDRRCLSKNITPSRLGMPATCGGGCMAIELHTMADIASCLVCRQQETTAQFLTASVGTAPPDLPANRPPLGSLQCNRRLVRASTKAIRNTARALGACELGNLAAASPVVCATALAAAIADHEAQVDERVAQCGTPTDVLACPFLPMADPACLGDAGTSVAETAIGAIYVQD